MLMDEGNDDSSNQSSRDNETPGICAWCQKPGVTSYHQKSSSGSPKTFCSELCFTLCRRASFKNNKVCDWCKHVRHTVTYVDFQDGDRQLQFCSQKCLNQYKMNIFCKETQEHLQQLQEGNSSLNNNRSSSNGSMMSPNDTDSQHAILITPELWTSSEKNQGGKNREGSAAKADLPAQRSKGEERDSSTHEKGVNSALSKDPQDPQPVQRRRSSPGNSRYLISKNPALDAKPHREDRTRHWQSLRAASDKIKKEKTSDATSGVSLSVVTTSPASLQSTPHSTSNAGLCPPTSLPELSSLPQFSMLGTFAGQPNPFLYNPLLPVSLQSTTPNSAFSSLGLTNPMMNPDVSGAAQQSETLTRAGAADTAPHFVPQLNPLAAAHLFGTVPAPPNLPSIPPLPGFPPGVPVPPRMAPPMPSMLPPNTLVAPCPYLIPLPVPVPIPIPVPPKAYKKFMEKEILPHQDGNQRIEHGGRSKSADGFTPVKSAEKRQDHSKGEHSTCSEREKSCSNVGGKIVCACCQTEGSGAPDTISRPIKKERCESRPSSSRSNSPPPPDHPASLYGLPPQDFSTNGVIDLSSKKSSHDRKDSDSHDHNRNATRSNRTPPGPATSDAVAFNLSSLPNPADISYSSRRSLILDAPPTPKDRKRSPSPERRLYYSVSAREMYGKRRCIRTRIKTK